MRIALASLPFPGSPEEAVGRVETALAEAARAGARIVCTPENYLPGLRNVGVDVAPHDEIEMAMAIARLAAAAARHGVGLILGTEVKLGESLVATAIVIGPNGRQLGRQDKCQIDPAEEGVYRPGHGRSIFTIDDLTFGIAICHEGWRYPETVRWAARRGAQIVFHPHFSPAAVNGYRPRHWADPANSFHEKAAMCRAAENSIFFATVNYAIDGSSTTSAVIDPDGALVACQARGEVGLLVVDIDPRAATGLLARRLRTDAYVDSGSSEVEPLLTELQLA